MMLTYIKYIKKKNVKFSSFLVSLEKKKFYAELETLFLWGKFKIFMKLFSMLKGSKKIYDGYSYCVFVRSTVDIINFLSLFK